MRHLTMNRWKKFSEQLPGIIKENVPSVVNNMVPGMIDDHLKATHFTVMLQNALIVFLLIVILGFAVYIQIAK